MTEAERTSFYHRAAWLRLREDVLRRDHYECQECRRRVLSATAKGIELPASDRKIRRATLVHHLVHLEDAPELGLVESNLEAWCQRCHDIHHGRTPADWGKRRETQRLTPERW